MEPVHYEARKTALLFVDPYNDFLSEGGKRVIDTRELLAAIQEGVKS